MKKNYLKCFILFLMDSHSRAGHAVPHVPEACLSFRSQDIELFRHILIDYTCSASLHQGLMEPKHLISAFFICQQPKLLNQTHKPQNFKIYSQHLRESPPALTQSISHYSDKNGFPGSVFSLWPFEIYMNYYDYCLV